MKQSPDIIVIGAGVIGLSCAWKLRERGASVTILEKDDGSTGASSASLGVLAPPTSLGVNDLQKLQRKSLEMFPGFTKEAKELTNIDVLYSRPGLLEIIPSEHQYARAFREAEFVREKGLLIHNDPILELLSPDDAEKLEPEAISTPFGALYCRMSAKVSVEKLMQALRSACLKTGVIIKQDCAVSGLSRNRDRITGVSVKGEELFSGKVLIAAGSWTPQLSPELSSYTDINPVRGQALRLKSDKPLTGRIIRFEKRYVIPNSRTSYDLGSTTEKESGFNTNTTAKGINEILNATLEAVPALSGATVEKMWAGLRPASPDSRPYLGEVPETEGLFVTAGHYKIGFGLAPVTAAVISELMTEGKSSFDFESLKPRRVELTKRRR